MPLMSAMGRNNSLERNGCKDVIRMYPFAYLPQLHQVQVVQLIYSGKEPPSTLRPNEHSRAYLHSLDGWRAIAVGAVMLDHAQPFGPRFVQHHLQNNGAEGVWLFFAISGLLICSRMIAEESTYGRVSLRNFYIRRAFRILPAALLYLLVIALLGSLNVLPFDLPSWLGAVFFYRNYWHYFFGANAGSWFTGHFWSLSVEEQFYLLWPAALLLLGKRKAVYEKFANATNLNRKSGVA